MSRRFGSTTLFIAWLATSIACAGCATDSFTPGFQTQSIGHQRGGGFMLSEWQRNLSCDRLGDALRSRAARMTELTNLEKTARQGLPPTILSAISWSTGHPLADSRTMRRHKRLRDESNAYHAVMLARQCPSIDVIALYKDAAMPQPAPDYGKTASQAMQAFSSRADQ